MKILLLFSLLMGEVYAEVVSGLGVAPPDYNNLNEAKENARLDAIRGYQFKRYSDYRECLTDDTLDNYEAIFLNEKSLQLTSKNIILHASFEVDEKRDLEKSLYEKCKKKYAYEQRISSLKQTINHFHTLNHFHMGAGIIGWADNIGGEVFVGYEGDMLALHGTYSYQSLVRTFIYKEYTKNIAIEASVRGNFNDFDAGGLYGYEHILNHRNPIDETIVSSAIVWGFFYQEHNSRMEYSVIFKDYDENNSLRKRSFSGGIRVRYKFF